MRITSLALNNFNFCTRVFCKMSLYDGIEVETAPIPPINIQQAMEVDQREGEKPSMTSPPTVPSSSTTETSSKWSRE